MSNAPGQKAWTTREWRLLAIILLAVLVAFAVSTFIWGGWKLPKLGKASVVVSSTTTTVSTKLPDTAEKIRLSKLKPKVNPGKLVKPKVTEQKALELPKPAEPPKTPESPKALEPTASTATTVQVPSTTTTVMTPKAPEPQKPEPPKTLEPTPVVTPKVAAATTIKVETAKKPAFVILKDLKTGKVIGMLPPVVKAGTPMADLLLGGAINQDGSAIKQTQAAVKALADIVGPKAERVVGEILNTPAAQPATVVLDLPAVKPAVEPKAVVPEVVVPLPKAEEKPVVASTTTSTTTTVAPKPAEEKPKGGLVDLTSTTTTVPCKPSSGLKPIDPLSFHW